MFRPGTSMWQAASPASLPGLLNTTTPLGCDAVIFQNEGRCDDERVNVGR